MQPTSAGDVGAPSHRKGSLTGFLANGVLLALLVLVILRIAVPSFRGWYHEDDLHNLRWALEYRSEPWKALTERHALHDHIRPLTLMAIWLGTYLSDGAYWGQHLVLEALNILAVLGLMALARARSGSFRAAMLTGLLAVAGLGWARLMDWNALVNSAGETALGIWGLVAVQRALTRPRWLAVAALAMLGSALFKEPGSFIYPVTAAAMAWSAWRGGARDRQIRLIPGLVALGLGAFLWTWHSANVERMETLSTPLSARLFGFLAEHARPLINCWPGPDTTGVPLGAGIPALILGLVLGRDLLPASLRATPAGRAGWLGGAAAFWLVCAIWPAVSGLLLMLLVVLVLIRRRGDLPPGLVMYPVSIAIMAPFAQVSEVQQIVAAAHGLALYAGLELDRMIDEEEPASLDRRMGIAGALMIAAILFFGRLLHTPNVSTYTVQREQANKILGYGALVRTLSLNGAQVAGMNMTDQEVLPLVGIELRSPDAAEAPTVAVSGGLLLVPPPGAIEQVLFPRDVIQGVTLPTILGGLTTGKAGAAPQGAPFDIAPGYYALGVGTSLGVQMQLTLTAMDGCGHVWTASQNRSLPVPFSLTPLVMEAGCGPLKLGWVGDAEEPDGIAMLAALERPIVSMWHPIEIPHLLSVDPSVVPRTLDQR